MEWNHWTTLYRTIIGLLKRSVRYICFLEVLNQGYGSIGTLGLHCLYVHSSFTANVFIFILEKMYH